MPDLAGVYNAGSRSPVTLTLLLLDAIYQLAIFCCFASFLSQSLLLLSPSSTPCSSDSAVSGRTGGRQWQDAKTRVTSDRSILDMVWCGCCVVVLVWYVVVRCGVWLCCGVRCGVGCGCGCVVLGLAWWLLGSLLCDVELLQWKQMTVVAVVDNSRGLNGQSCYTTTRKDAVTSGDPGDGWTP